MHHIPQLIPGAVMTLLRDQPLSAGKVAFAWRLAVGAAVDRASAIGLRDGGVLEVRVTDAQWAVELKRMAPIVKSRLETMLGDGSITRIDVRIGR